MSSVHRLLLAGLMLIVAGLIPTAVHAAEFRGGDVVTIGPETTVRDDLYVAGETVTVEGRIDGDLFVVGSTVVVSGRIAGSLFGAAQHLTILGAVDGDVRVAAQTVSVGAPVQGDLFAAGEAVSVTRTSSVGRDTFAAGNRLSIDGPIERQLRATGSTVSLGSSVGGDVLLGPVEKLSLSSGADLRGNLSYESAHELTRHSDARVGGTVSRREPVEEKRGESDHSGVNLIGIFFRILAITFVGAVALLLTPRGMDLASRALVRQPLFTLGWGFVVLAGGPIVMLLLLITVIGIPVAIMVGLVWAMLLYACQTVVALTLGRLLLSRLRPIEGLGWSIVAVLAGALLVAALKVVPYMEGIVTLAVLLFGLGAVLMAYYESRRTASAVQTAQSVSPSE